MLYSIDIGRYIDTIESIVAIYRSIKIFGIIESIVAKHRSIKIYCYYRIRGCNT